MSDSAPQTIGSYELVRLLGRGGMGEVHLARDSRLGRDVALKLLPEDLAEDGERRTRFLREARAAAALNHPNITTIHDVGVADGRDYIAQEYLDGRALSELVVERTLPVTELAELAVPLAEALGYAHERGVIHRDLKAANVIVTGRGHPKLLDFGLAKVMHDASAGGTDQSTTLTIQGAIFGTPSAMSPEQALGRTVDSRSDVFSFGSLLYEMAAGKPPFLGTTVQETLDKVVHEAPEPLGRLRRDLPADFLSIVEKAHRKEPDERYQTMEDLAADLRHFKRKTDSGLVPPVRPRVQPTGVPMGAVLVLVAALGSLVIWRPWSLPPPSAPIGAVVEDAPRYAAVMYVEHLTDPDDIERYGPMLAHLLTTELSSARGIDMLSQQRLFETARRLGRDDGTIDKAIASEVAQAAGVGTMVLGQVSRVGSKVLATVTMVDAVTGAEVGTARAEGRSSEDLFEMAESLGGQVRIALGGRAGSGASLEQQLTGSIEAYRAYVRGQQALNQNEFDEAVEHLRQATELDPAFAMANFWLAITLQWLTGTTDESVLAMERALVHSERLAADVRSIARGALLSTRGQYTEALPILEAAVAADPDNRTALHLLGELRLHSSAHGDAAEAARLFVRTMEVDPGFTMLRDHLLAALVFAGDSQRALDLVDEWPLESESERNSLLFNTALRMGDHERLDELRARRRRTRGPAAPDLTSELASDRRYLADIERTLAGLSESERAETRSYLVAPALIHVGRFGEALPHLTAAPRPRYLPAYDWEANGWGAARQDEAFLHELAGDLASARTAAARALDAQPLAYRHLYSCAQLAARDGDLSTARQLAARLDALLEQGLGVMAPVYRDAAWAEIALAEDQPAEAVRLYARAVERDRFMNDWFSDNRTFGPVIREGLARAHLAHGDPQAARQALLALHEARAEHNGPYTLHAIRALYTLGVLELQAGDVENGKAHLHRFLDHWGEADWELDMVEDARARLAAL